MTTFHRFVDPSYANAPVLGVGPATTAFDGILYNRFNVTSGGTGGGGSAFMDANKGAGPNVGTYAVAFGEDASSSNANRGLRALAENTDYLDDLFHRDIALPITTSTTVSGVGGDTSIVLPAETFVGDTLTYPLEMLFAVVDDLDREIMNAGTGTKVTVSTIAGATIGDGFAAGAVTLNFSTAVPEGITYKVHYTTRSNLATLPADALSFVRIRPAEEDNWFRFSEEGHGKTVVEENDNISVTGWIGEGEDLLGGAWSTFLKSDFNYVSTASRLAFHSGSVFIGLRQTLTTDQSPGTPGLYSSFHGARTVMTVNQPTARTQLLIGDVVTLNAGSITLPGTSWFYNGGNGAFALGQDILRVEIAGKIHNLLVIATGSATTGTVVYPDGAVPTFAPGTAATIVDWIRTTSYETDGSQEYRRITSGAGTIYQNGFFFASLPPNDNVAVPVTAPADRSYAKFFSRTTTSTDRALVWGGYNKTTLSYEEKGWLTGDGSLYCSQTLYADNGITLGGGNVDFTNSDYFSWAGVDFLLAGPVRISGHVRSYGASELKYKTSASAPTVDLSTVGTCLEWDLSGKAAGTYTMTLNNIEAESTFAPPRITVVVYAVDDGVNFPTDVAFSVTGYSNRADTGTYTLTAPPPLGTSWNVFTGHVLADANIIVWTKTSFFI